MIRVHTTALADLINRCIGFATDARVANIAASLAALASIVVSLDRPLGVAASFV